MAAQFKVFKKVSSNGKLTLYLGRRDFADHITAVDPVDGIVIIDPDYIQDRKVFGQLVCSFRYGREDDEMMGLSFQKDLFLASEQIYPQENVEYTKLQERLMKKLGDSAYPFTLRMPLCGPPSVTIQQAPEDHGKPCGVEYYVKVFVADSEEERTHKRSTITLSIRRIQFAPNSRGRQPCTIVRKEFMLSPGELELEVTLDKQLYYHGEKITVNVMVRNHSNKTIKKVTASVHQCTEICLFSGGQLRCSVAKAEIQDGCPVEPESVLQKVLYLKPSLQNKKFLRGVALDGQLKNALTNLASTTLLSNPDDRKIFGMVISYSVRVKLYLVAMGGDVSAELPIILMHPKLDLRKMMRADSQVQVESFRSESFATSFETTEDMRNIFI